MKPTSLRLLAIPSLCCFLWPLSVARAVDEERALSILVDALAEAESPLVQESLLRGMLAGLEGRRNLAAPDRWPQVAERLSRSTRQDIRELSAQLAQLFGDETATRRALGRVVDRKLAGAVRRRALHSLLTQKNRDVAELLPELLGDPQLRLDAIRGFAAVEVQRAPALLLKLYREAKPEERRAIIETLAARRAYAVALLDAIKNKTVSREEIPAHVARSLNLILGDAFAEVFGDVRKLSDDRKTLIANYKKLITEDALADADASRGRAVFQKTCASCHMLYGTGGKIGPDLTGSNRANLDYLLLNSVDPSYDVPEGYKMVIIETADGRVLNGVIAEENGSRIILKTVEQPEVVILKSDIENRRVSAKSMMPEGQLEQMKPADIINLVKYLQTIEQVEIAQ